MPKRFDEATKRQMILDCRQSGMSDQRWCAEHGISTTSFYRWIRMFQEQACMEIPEKANAIAPVQDVVKLEVIPERPLQKRDHFTPDPAICDTKQHYFTPTVSLNAFGTEIHLCNEADPELVRCLLQMLGGLRGSVISALPMIFTLYADTLICASRSMDYALSSSIPFR